MPDEEIIDKLVKDAANQHHPPYDDTAWGKMEVLLDKHLPQNKDRRRPIFFLLLFLLLGGGAVFFAVENAQKNNNNTTATAGNAAGEKKSGTPAAPVTAGTTTASSSGVVDADPDNPGTATADNNVPGQQKDQILNTNTVTTNTKHGLTSAKNKLRINIRQPNAVEDGNNDPQYSSTKRNSGDQKSRLKITIKKPGASDDDAIQKQKDAVVKNDVDVTEASPAVTKADKVAIDEVNTNTTDKKETAVTKTDSTATAKTETEKKPAPEKSNTASANKQNKKSFTDKIAVTLSAGADLSYIELSNAGKLKPVYGAGLSYAFGKHFVVSSGLYVSKKVYTASPYQYKFAGYTTPANLKEVGADCKIFEIPLTVYYSSRQVKNHNWLGGIGLSSLLMKKEAYDYRYETPSGQTWNYEKTITNENKHYFSVLTISGGYQYRLNNYLSFIAEPYVKIPLTGIGMGKLKLNSTGVLVTAAIKPFAKKKR